MYTESKFEGFHETNRGCTYGVAKCDSFDSWATFGVLVDQEKCLSGIYLFLPGIMPKVRVPVPTNIATVPFRHYSYIHKKSDWLRFMDLGQIHMRSWYQLIAAVSVSVLIHLLKKNSIGTPVQTLIPGFPLSESARSAFPAAPRPPPSSRPRQWTSEATKPAAPAKPSSKVMATSFFQGGYIGYMGCYGDHVFFFKNWITYDKIDRTNTKHIKNWGSASCSQDFKYLLSLVTKRPPQAVLALVLMVTLMLAVIRMVPAIGTGGHTIFIWKGWITDLSCLIV